MTMNLDQLELSYHRSSANSWFVAHNTCRLMRMGAIVASIFLIIQLAQHGHLDWQTAKLSASLLGSLIGVYAFHKGKQKAQIQGRTHQRMTEIYQNCLEGKTSEESKLLKFLRRIDRAVYRYFSHLTSSTPNKAKREVIGQCLDNIDCPEFVKVAKQFEVDVSPIIRFPSGPGICHGACLHFANRFFAGHKISEILQEFEGGAPYKANLYQGYRENITLRLKSSHADVSLIDYVVPAKMAGLEVPYLDKNLLIDRAGHSITTSAYTVHQVTFRKPETAGTEGHSVLIIKSDDKYCLFDPNIKNQVIYATDLHEILQFIETAYTLPPNRSTFHVIPLTKGELQQ